MTALSRIRRPRSVSTSYDARRVAAAYNFPLSFTGKGFTVGIIELGGGFSVAEVDQYLQGLGIQRTGKLTSVGVSGGQNKSDGANGADGEVLLDIEVIAAVAPGADINVYFAPNTDSGFLDAIKRAVADGCAAVSISWGQAESGWSARTIDEYDAVFAQARAAGSIVLAAAGDTGSQDGGGDGKNHVDFPASSPNVLGCGGTRLTLDAKGQRATETTWNDDPTSSATGGGVSVHFPGRQVPDIAGNADPATGYEILVDGQTYVIGGTSAVAPLMAGLVLLLSEALGMALGKKVDLLNTIVTNPGVCWDVTVGDNGGYRAGVGRDEVTGFGVIDGEKLLAVLTDNIADPAPIGSGRPVDPGQPAPAPAPVPAPPVPAPVTLSANVVGWARRTTGSIWKPKRDREAAAELLHEFGLK